MRTIKKELRIRRRMIRRLIRLQRDAMILRLLPAIAGIQLVMIATEGGAADHTPDPAP